MLTLSPKTEDVLATMPPYEADDPFAQRFMEAVCRELQRVEDFMVAVSLQVRPQFADDSWGLLGLAELLFGLPVEPEGVALHRRIATVLAAARKRSSGTGAGFVDVMDQLIGSQAWVGQENAPAGYEFTMKLPTGADSYTSAQVQALATAMLGSHIRLFFEYGDSFKVGSAVGDQL